MFFAGGFATVYTIYVPKKIPVMNTFLKEDTGSFTGIFFD